MSGNSSSSSSSSNGDWREYKKLVLSTMEKTDKQLVQLRDVLQGIDKGLTETRAQIKAMASDIIEVETKLNGTSKGLGVGAVTGGGLVAIVEAVRMFMHTP